MKSYVIVILGIHYNNFAIFKDSTITSRNLIKCIRSLNILWNIKTGNLQMNGNKVTKPTENNALLAVLKQSYKYSPYIQHCRQSRFYPSGRYLWMKVAGWISRSRPPLALLAMFSPSPLPWFVYSNLLQNASRPFINPTHLTWHGYLYAQTYVLAMHRKLRLKFYVHSSSLSWLKQYTKHLYWKH